MKKFIESTNALVSLSCFNHTKQQPVVLHINDAEDLQELLEWMQNAQQELTVESVDIDNSEFPSLASFAKLTKCLDDVLSLIEQYDAEKVADYLEQFSSEDLHLFEDAYTGCTDFKEYAQEVADDLLSNCKNDLAARFFDYDAFERDLVRDYYVGRYVWRSV